MATVPINQAASAIQVTSEQPAQGSPGFPSELQASMSLADIPDPGGGPPLITAEGRASNPGPNALSNQPDFLPLLAGAGLPPQPVGTSPLGGPPSKGAKSASLDLTLLALTGLVGAGIVPTPAGPIETGPAQAGVASVAGGANGAIAVQATPTQVATHQVTLVDPTIGPAPTGQVTTAQEASAPATTAHEGAPAPSVPPQIDSRQAPAQPAQTLQVVVDAPSVSQASRPLPAIQNAVVSAVVTKATAPTAADVPIAATPTTDDQSGGSSGNTAGDQPSNQQPDPTEAGLISTLPGASQATPVTSTTPVAGPALSAPQRFDVVRQVADRIELMAAARPQEGVTIHLQPHGLGDVTIIVKGIGKDIEATFSATNPTVRNALADSRDALTEAVTAKGYNLVGVNITAHSQSMTGRDRQSSSNQQPQSQAFGSPSSSGGPNGSSNSRGGALSSSVSTSTGTEDAAELPSIGVEGVDYRI